MITLYMFVPGVLLGVVGGWALARRIVLLRTEITIIEILGAATIVSSAFMVEMVSPRNMLLVVEMCVTNLAALAASAVCTFLAICMRRWLFGTT